MIIGSLKLNSAFKSFIQNAIFVEVISETRVSVYNIYACVPFLVNFTREV